MPLRVIGNLVHALWAKCSTGSGFERSLSHPAGTTARDALETTGTGGGHPPASATGGPETGTYSSASAAAHASRGPMVLGLPSALLGEVLRRLPAEDYARARAVNRTFRQGADDVKDVVVSEAMIKAGLNDTLRALFPVGVTFEPGWLRLAACPQEGRRTTFCSEALGRTSAARPLGEAELIGAIAALSSDRLGVGEVAVAHYVSVLAAQNPSAKEALLGCVRAEWEPDAWPILESATGSGAVDEIKALREVLLRAPSWAHAQQAATERTILGRSLLKPRSLATTPHHWIAHPTHTLFEAHEDAILGLASLPDGRFVSVSSDKTARVWTESVVGTWRFVQLQGHEAAIQGVAVLPDGRLVTASDDMTARVWREGANGHWAFAPLRGHGSSCVDTTALPDGRIVTISLDRTARIWREGSDHTWASEAVFTFDGPLHVVRALSNGRFLTASKHNGKEKRLFRKRSEGLGWASVVLQSRSGTHPDSIWGATPLSRNRMVTVSAREATAWLWKEAPDGSWDSIPLHAHTCGIWNATALSDGTWVSTSGDRTARVWRESADGGWSSFALHGHEGEVVGATALADGRLVTFGLLGRSLLIHGLPA